MMFTMRSLVYSVCSLWLVAAVFPNVSFAQAEFSLVVSDDPDDYVRSLLEEIEAEGMSSIRHEIERMGLRSPQLESAISVLEGVQNKSEERWTELIGVVESGNSLRQYYGYAFLGGNGWMFLRLDFLRKSNSDWILANFVFDSDYSAVVTTSLDFLD